MLELYSQKLGYDSWLGWYILYDIGDGDYDDIGGYDLISLIWYCDADYDVISGDDIPCITWFI